jgi:hypothetical protein
VASAADFSADWFCCVIRATCATVDPSPSCASFRTAECKYALPDDFRRIGALRTIDRRHVDSLHRYSRLLFYCGNRQSSRLASIFTMQIPKVPRRISPPRLSEDMLEGMTLAWKTALFLSLFTLLAIVTFCTKPYTQFMPIFARHILPVGAQGLGLLLMAPGAGAILGGLTLASVTRFPRPHQLLLFLAGGFASSIILFALSGNFPLSLLSLFFAGGFQTTFLSSIATPFASLHGRKRPGDGSCLCLD